MFVNACECVDVLECVRMFVDVSECLWMFVDVCGCPCLCVLLVGVFVCVFV